MDVGVGLKPSQRLPTVAVLLPKGLLAVLPANTESVDRHGTMSDTEIPRVWRLDLWTTECHSELIANHHVPHDDDSRVCCRLV